MTPEKVLLTSVFKPFSVDDEFGVKENVCELMHNQVTRGQGVFSIRSHNRSFGLTLMAENIQPPVTVMDFPTMEEFSREIQVGGYTHVGISFIVPNFVKARAMARQVRTLSPGTKIIIGGHGAAIPDIRTLMECDEICLGDGVGFLRRLFGETETRPLVHPIMPLDCYRKILGAEIPNTKAVLMPGVGCNKRCDFCCTSHFFNGYTPFFPSPEALFETMVAISEKLSLREFFILDENFLADPVWIHRLLELSREHGKPFVLDVFSSLDHLAQYDPQTLWELGVQFVWVGIETRDPLYAKTRNVDAKAVFARCRGYGISILASSILFLPGHTPTNIDEDINYTISLKPDFIQFMELSPLPGTTLFEQLKLQGRILGNVPLKEWHGQGNIWFRHPHFSRPETKRILDLAFDREYQMLGPSLLRIAETRLLPLEGPPLPGGGGFARRRGEDTRFFARQMIPLLPAIRNMAPNNRIRRKADLLRKRYERVFGRSGPLETVTGILVDLLGRIEEGRVRRGTNIHQPPTFIDRYRQR